MKTLIAIALIMVAIKLILRRKYGNKETLEKLITAALEKMEQELGIK